MGFKLEAAIMMIQGRLIVGNSVQGDGSVYPFL